MYKLLQPITVTQARAVVAPQALKRQIRVPEAVVDRLE